MSGPLPQFYTESNCFRHERPGVVSDRASLSQLLDCGLTLDEVNYVTEMARRLAALVEMQAEMDASYKKVAGSVS